MRLLFTRFLLSLGLVTFVVFAAHAAPISEVRVRGNLRIDEGALLVKLASRVGQEYDAQTVREDIRTIYATGYFDDVVVERDEQNRLTFIVLERPALRDWWLEGDDELDMEDVEEAMPLKRREVLPRDDVGEGAEAIRILYQEKGYFLAVAEPEVVPVDDGNNQVDLVYHITRGDKVKLRDFHLMGVSEELREDISGGFMLQEVGFLSWLSGSGTFKEAELNRDRDWTQHYLLEQGYADARIDTPLVTVSPDLRYLQIDLPVTPGEIYNFGEINFSGDSYFSEERMAGAIKVKPGDRFAASKLRSAVQKLKDLHADEGFAFSQVLPRTRLDEQNRLVVVDLNVNKGDKVYVGRIEVRGNTKTRDRIVRRDMRLAEGDLYNATLLKKSERTINNLGYFEGVNITMHRRPGTNLVDIDIEVQEGPTGTFSVGAGYSSDEGLVGMANISQRNLLGYGYQLAADATFGTEKETYSLNFNNPRLFDTHIFAGFEVYNAFREYSEYDRDAKGFRIKTGTKLSEHWSVRLSYLYDDSEVTGVCTDERVAAGECTDPASAVVQDQAGHTLTSALMPVIVYSTVDNPWQPSTGTSGRYEMQWAGGPLGGDAGYLKHEVDLKQFYPLFWEWVFMARARGGHVQGLYGEEVPLYELFALGGINTLRGFDWRSVGPEDPDTGEVIGGDKFALFNAEIVFPISKEFKFNGVFFFDAGNAWDFDEDAFSSRLRTSAGAGIRWNSPMGPIRLEYAFNLDPEEDEDDAKWEFAMGGFF